MAKGDANASQNQIDTQGGRAQNNLNNLWGQNTDRTTNFQNLYQGAVGQNQDNYNNIMGMFQSFLNPSNKTGAQVPTTTNQSINKTYQGGDPQSFFQSLTNGVAPTRDNLLAMAPQLEANGFSLVPNATMGPDGKPTNYDVRTPDGRVIDVMQGGSRGGEAWQWMEPTSGIGGMNQYGGSIDQALAGYGDFAKNGGFSPQDIANLRARAIAPTRAIYANAQANVDRSRALQGGTGANYNAAQAKMARDEAATIGDQNQQADAGIAQLMQQGKLYGLGGLANTGLGAYGADTSAFLGNQGQQLTNALGVRGQNLSAINGAGNLYGTTPGLTNMFGNQVLNSSGQGVQLGGLQNQLAGILTQAQNSKAQIPGNFQSALGNIAGLFGLGGNIASGLSGMFGGGGGQNFLPDGAVGPVQRG